MRNSLQRKKRAGGQTVATTSGPYKRFLRLFVVDAISKIHFLVDTGADLSILPRKFAGWRKQIPQTRYNLQAANGVKIEVYGEKTISVKGLRKIFTWTFVVANCTDAIIGAAFLHNFSLVVDIKNKRLIDTETDVTVRAKTKSVKLSGVQVVVENADAQYQQLLRKYPGVLRPAPTLSEIKHSVVHHIVTVGPPSHCKPRRLPPDKLQSAKEEFRQMQKLGIIQPSSSEWSSPLHMVPKK